MKGIPPVLDRVEVLSRDMTPSTSTVELSSWILPILSICVSCIHAMSMLLAQALIIALRISPSVLGESTFMDAICKDPPP